MATFLKFPSSSRTIISIPDDTPDHCEHAVVPPIIHQVKLGGLVMRPTWQEARSSCQALHPDWTFRLWEDAEADAFVKEHYPQIFSVYHGYPLGEHDSIYHFKTGD